MSFSGSAAGGARGVGGGRAQGQQEVQPDGSTAVNVNAALEEVGDAAGSQAQAPAKKKKKKKKKKAAAAAQDQVTLNNVDDAEEGQ